MKSQNNCSVHRFITPVIMVITPAKKALILLLSIYWCFVTSSYVIVTNGTNPANGPRGHFSAILIASNYGLCGFLYRVRFTASIRPHYLFKYFFCLNKVTSEQPPQGMQRPTALSKQKKDRSHSFYAGFTFFEISA